MKSLDKMKPCRYIEFVKQFQELNVDVVEITGTIRIRQRQANGRFPRVFRPENLKSAIRLLGLEYKICAFERDGKAYIMNSTPKNKMSCVSK